MTRIFEVGNTSNWDGEDYAVIAQGFNGEAKSVYLKPGDKMSIPDAHSSGGVLYYPVDRRDEGIHHMSIAESFRDAEGNQLTPRMEIYFVNSQGERVEKV